MSRVPDTIDDQSAGVFCEVTSRANSSPTVVLKSLPTVNVQWQISGELQTVLYAGSESRNLSNILGTADYHRSFQLDGFELARGNCLYRETTKAFQSG